MQDPFKDARYRQLFAGFMCGGVRDLVSQGALIEPRDIDALAMKWIALDEEGVTAAMVSLGDALNMKRA